MNYPEPGIGRINFTVVILNTKVVVAQGGTEIKGVIPIDITPHQPQRVAGFYSPLDKHRHVCQTIVTNVALKNITTVYHSVCLLSKGYSTSCMEVHSRGSLKSRRIARYVQYGIQFAWHNITHHIFSVAANIIFGCGSIICQPFRVKFACK